MAIFQCLRLLAFLRVWFRPLLRHGFPVVSVKFALYGCSVLPVSGRGGVFVFRLVTRRAF